MTPLLECRKNFPPPFPELFTKLLALRKIAKHLTSAAQNHYIFDFMTIEAPFKERELETGLIHQLEKFLLELGAGFALVGRQHHLEIGCLQFVRPEH
ncbi:MAG: PDDEXK nuclease domain-containing protein [Desulfobacterales bacterium]